MVVNPSVAKRRAQKEMEGYLRKKAELEKRIEKIDMDLQTLLPTIELIDENQRENLEKEIKKLESEKDSLSSKRRRVALEIEKLNAQIFEVESKLKTLKRICAGLRIPKFLLGVFTVIIAARIFSTAELLNQSFGLVPGILDLFKIHVSSELSQRLVLLLDLLLVETVLSLGFYTVFRAFFSAVDQFLFVYNRKVILLLFHVFFSVVSLGIMLFTLFKVASI